MLPRVVDTVPFPVTRSFVFFLVEDAPRCSDMQDEESLRKYIAECDGRNVMPFYLKEYEFDSISGCYKPSADPPVIPDSFSAEIQREVELRLKEQRQPFSLHYWRDSKPDHSREHLQGLLRIVEERTTAGYDLRSVKLTLKGDSGVHYGYKIRRPEESSSTQFSLQLILPVPIRARAHYSKEEREQLKAWHNDLSDCF